ncbi:MAG: acyl-ACP--UDP-N-acetylglucosamine O-acyltransferase [Planctomycetes bacterium]|nr:acyl-ACP--UDP-N-acetylglucosamine O-acyltransferase [Planctomycetota bacterium]
MGVHPLAVVHQNARIADDVEIGPFCVIGPDVAIGPGTRLANHVSILGITTIGRGNAFSPFASIGGPPQDKKYAGEPTRLVIGDHNSFRESVTVNVGTAHGGGVTTIGDNNLLMAYAHVAHDCRLGNSNIIANSVNLAGHVVVGDFANISGMTGVHHFTSIGDHAFIGGLSRVTQDVPPYMMVVGAAGQVVGVNKLGLRRAGFTEADVEEVVKAHRRLYRGVTPRAQVIEEMESESHCPAVGNLIAFLKRQSLGVSGRYLESLRHKDDAPARAPVGEEAAS